MWSRVFVLIGMFLISCNLMAQAKGKAHDLKREADRAYDLKKYDSAEEAYRKATIVNPDDKGVFNLGNAIFNQNRYEEAARQYEKAADLIEDPREKAKAWYNLGNAHYLNGKYDESVNAYKRSLIADPADLQAKQNLLMALRELETQEQQKQQQENKDNNEQQEEQQQQQENQEEQDQQQQQSENEDQPEQAQELEQKLSKEQAMQLLEIIEEEDQKVQEKLRKKEAGEKKKTKDW
ncbi:MAG: tetratricopeptide repeat protein [Saprospiraceae bacterium]|nr:tetratricopeptide repeat protein [Saprospiraceae bacterium]